MPNPNLPNQAGYNTYVGARYVPVFSSINNGQWTNTVEYEPLTIVMHNGNSYTSKTYVPIGIDINNTTYWASTGNYNAQIEQYRQEVLNLTPYAKLIKQQLYGKKILIIGSSNEAPEGIYPDVDPWTVELQKALQGIATVTINAVGGRLLYDDMVALDGAIGENNIIIIAHSRNDASNDIEIGNISSPDSSKKDIASAGQYLRNIVAAHQDKTFYYISMPRPSIANINSYKYPYALYLQMDKMIADWAGVYFINGTNLFGNYPSSAFNTIMPDGSHVTYPFTLYTAYRVLFKLLSAASDSISINETRQINDLYTAADNVTVSVANLKISDNILKFDFVFKIAAKPEINTPILKLDPSLIKIIAQAPYFTFPATISDAAGDFNYYKGSVGASGSVYFKEAAPAAGSFHMSFYIINNNLYSLL